jgi:hypothetical protein
MGQPTLVEVARVAPVSGVNAEARDARHVSAWCEWLNALAVDAEAALAAAIAYQELDDEGRDRWLLALEHDAGFLSAPRIAIYAPLLAVESDPERRGRIALAMGPTDAATWLDAAPMALAGTSRSGLKLAVVVRPLYLDFVQVLLCAYRSRHGFEWVRHDPIVALGHAPQSGSRLEGVTMEAVSLKQVVDDLAHAVLAHQRCGREHPEPLKLFSDLFRPELVVV